MSIENLLNEYPDGQSIRTIVGQKKSKGESGSLISLFAEDLRRVARDGLRQLTAELNPSDVLIRPDTRTFLSGLSPEKRALRDYYHLLIVALSVISLEETLIDKKFNMETLCVRYNSAISGTLFPPAEVNGEKIETLSEDQWREMLKYCIQDPTFAIFFEEGIDIVPRNLRAIWEVAGLNGIRSIIPFYRERAQYLTSKE